MGIQSETQAERKTSQETARKTKCQRASPTASGAGQTTIPQEEIL